MFKAEIAHAMKIRSDYRQNKQNLCSDLLLLLDKNLRAAVSQHPNYSDAKSQDNIIQLWEIVVECATGRGAHSVYVSMMRFINLKQKSDTLDGFTEYVKKYNETVADLMRIGGSDPGKVMRWLFNAKFVQGLHADQFRDQIKNIMGKEQWPDYQDLQAQLKRFATASKGIADTFAKDNPDGIIVADATRTSPSGKFNSECYNCGKRNVRHRARDCPEVPHECSQCKRTGHLEKFCRYKSEEKRNTQSENTKLRDATRQKERPRQRVQAKRVINMYDNDSWTNGEDMYDDEDEEQDMVMHSKRGIVTIENETPAISCRRTTALPTTDEELFAVDSCCIGHGHLVRREDLLTMACRGRVTIQGYDGKATTTNTIGHVNGIGKAVLVPDAPNNLINLRKLCDDIGGRYVGDANSMTIYDAKDEIYAEAKDHGDGFLSLRYKDVRDYLNIKANAVTTGRQVDADHYSAEEITRAKDAYELCALLGHPGHKALCRALDNSNYNGCHLTSSDVRNALALYGKCLGCMEGKIKAPPAVTSKTPPARKVGEHIYVDIYPFTERAIGGFMGALFAVDEKSSYCMVVGLRSKRDITKACETMMHHYNSHRHEIKRITADDEQVFENRLEPLRKYGIEPTATPAGLKNKRAERYIQTMKSRIRSILATIPYKLPTKLRLELLIAAVKGMNATANTVSGSRTPTEIFYGLKPIIPRYSFGQPGVVYNGNDKSSPGQWGIFLGYRDNHHHNNMRIYIPETDSVVSRMRFVPTDVIPHEWGYEPRLKQRAPTGGSKAIPMMLPAPRATLESTHTENLPLERVYNEIIQDRSNKGRNVSTHDQEGDVDERTPMDAVDGSYTTHKQQLQQLVKQQHNNGEMSDKMSDELTEGRRQQHKEGAREMSDEMSVERTEGRRQQAEESGGLKEGDTTRLNNRKQKDEEGAALDKNDTQHRNRVTQEVDDHATIPLIEEEQRTGPQQIDRSHRQRLPRKAAALNWKDGSAMNRNYYNSVKLKTDGERTEMKKFMAVYRISLTQAMRDVEMKEQRMNAARKEITNLYVTQKCLDPVQRGDIPREHQSMIMSGHMFFKDKYRADGSYDQCKARIVMNGNEQDPDTIDSTRAPTVNPISLMCTLAKSANDKHYTNDAYDVVGAFVCTEMPKDKIIIMKARGQLAKLFVEVFPELETYLDERGHLYFYLRRFLYGLAEAARGFNEKMHNVLTKMGYHRSRCDECLYLKRIKGGKLHHLCVHVDDVYSAAPSVESRLEFETAFGQHFEFKKQYDNISYLGMMIRKNKRNGEVTVDQQGYIRDLLQKYDVHEKAVGTPAKPNLMADSENEEYLEDKKEYVSMVMGLMYIARLTRADILMPVTYLATKCSSPTVTDYCNARWILRYLKGTRDKVIRYKASDMTLRFYADASYLLHGDGKGHSGYLATIGGTMVMARSSKQKLQARSSTEAEIIAVEDCTTYVVFMRHLCKEMDIKASEPTMVGQDNKSSMIIVEQGGTFKRTKHLIGRMGYIRECIGTGVITLVYVPTKVMRADMLTKPMPKEELKRHMEGVGLVN